MKRTLKFWTRESAEAAIIACENLRELLDTLVTIERDVNAEDAALHGGAGYISLSDVVDITGLPVFGGDDVIEQGVWSWDADSLLVGEGGCPTWRIIPRY